MKDVTEHGAYVPMSRWFMATMYTVLGSLSVLRQEVRLSQLYTSRVCTQHNTNQEMTARRTHIQTDRHDKRTHMIVEQLSVTFPVTFTPLSKDMEQVRLSAAIVPDPTVQVGGFDRYTATNEPEG